MNFHYVLHLFSQSNSRYHLFTTTYKTTGVFIPKFLNQLNRAQFLYYVYDSQDFLLTEVPSVQDASYLQQIELFCCLVKFFLANNLIPFNFFPADETKIISQLSRCNFISELIPLHFHQFFTSGVSKVNESIKMTMHSVDSAHFQ
jgi:hypothetical protein